MQSSSPPDTPDTKASFRKPSNDAANRRYRRRSPANGSSSSDGSPKRDHNASPIYSRDDPSKVPEHQQRRKDDERELDRDSGRSHHGRGSDSYRHSDRQSSRSSHNYSKHDDYVRHDKHENDEDRNYQRLSSRSGRESRDHSRSKDYLSSEERSSHDKYDVIGHGSKDKEKESSYLERQKNKDKDSSSDRAGSGRKHTVAYSEELDRDWHKRDRDGRDEKRDYRRSSGDHRNDRTVTYDESRGHRNYSSSGRDYGSYRLKEAHRSDPKELDGQKLANEEKKKHNDSETNRDRDRYHRADKPDFASGKQENPTKKQRFSNWDKGADNVKDAAGTMSSSSMQSQDIGDTDALAQSHANDAVANDLDAAKVAAMRAAELVNKNLVGGSYMSTDQKKKLLWGNKKSTPVEESARRWDTALIGDRDRQEKFNKLMGVKGNANVGHRPGDQDGGGHLQAEKQRELQLDLEKQYTAGLRRRDGRTVGLGL